MRRHTVVLTTLLLIGGTAACSFGTGETPRRDAAPRPTVSALALPTATKPPTSPTPALSTSARPAPAVSAPDPATEQAARYAAAVRAQAPSLARVSDDNLAVQGQLVCSLLDSGDSPKSVYQTMQSAYPDAAKAMTTSAPAIYCPKYTAAVNTALR
ncbi:hypothetical protein GCM10010495_73960 [Kitasatospora herbaricolor]|uniref:DUF732 domain-containing protein n=1 Tax=Kitasatospora herbaricolor TaxID=68217 RepID=UPI001749E9E8|nr:DUF732 domain-containing protein [Kitasatospora herbaricolor]MDQ0305450.1 hypothetical protein [Kitasatospora herbaricolor]GGV45613.1 hypothetical protein GCM10010495_73960 [Kitasatospora herbaricolor]